VRDSTPIYGSGGFTSYPLDRLQEQLGSWISAGIGRVKMKVGSRPDQDPIRVRAAREAIGSAAQLFVDANGAYSHKQALTLAGDFAECGVTWFEEPVSSDDLAGLQWLRDHVPPGMEIAAGEYGDNLVYFRRMLETGAVDVLQVDATRCGGITGFMQASTLSQAFNVPLSAHTAPALHAHLGCALPSLCHIEYFHDHVRIEDLLFEGSLKPAEGALRPDLSRPGLGLELRQKDAEPYAA
jgi:L-alanine-DL-glutamate epimerase-like enolase superfamily enzyme